MRPLILISGGVESRAWPFGDLAVRVSQRYGLAVWAAGGMPWVAPLTLRREWIDEMVARSAGVMLTGGDDVGPGLYRSKLSASLRRTLVPAVPERDYFELLLVEAVLRRRKPLLAICRGHQLLNVALGGTLLVDIHTQMPQALNHNRPRKACQCVHRLRLVPGSRLAVLAGRSFMEVNSTHHQGVHRLAEPFQATALAEDGIVEGIELRPGATGMSPYLLGVQWHPERLFDRHPEQLEIFGDFVRACRRAGR